MKSIAEQIIGDSGEIAPQACVDALHRVFKHALNIDWVKKGNFYEAIFYQDNFEIIALFTSDGAILEKKKFIANDQISRVVKSALKNHGEIMNVVQIEKNDQIYFEVIVRDSSLIRSVIYINADGSFIEKLKL